MKQIDPERFTLDGVTYIPTPAIWRPTKALSLHDRCDGCFATCSTPQCHIVSKRMYCGGQGMGPLVWLREGNAEDMARYIALKLES